MNANEELLVTTTEDDRVPLLTKIIYGSGDWGMASFGTVRQIFYAIFLVDVVGLSPNLASLAALIGMIWDGINDPIIGAISDRVRTRWGRRRPFLLLFAIPYGLGFLLLWWAPPWESQLALAAYVTFAFIITDTLWTLLGVPFLALTPEITADYDERTSLTTYRMLFNLLASLVAAAGAPEIVAAMPTPQQGYLVMAAIFGGAATLPFLGVFLVTRERGEYAELPTPTVKESIQAAWENIPFRIATLINLLNWITFDLVGLMIPFFTIYWLESGVQNAQVAIPGIGNLTTQTIIFFFMLTTAVAALPFWTFLAKKWNKHTAYIAGMAFWAVVQIAIMTIQPGQRTYTVILGILAGISVATAHVLPDALFPDVMEWDELRTGKRREGIYYGVRTFVRKIAGAIAISLALQVLYRAGYQQPTPGAPTFQQNETALLAIRLLTGPAGAILLLSAIVTAFFYPLNRKQHGRIRNLLARRKKRLAMADQTKSTAGS
jgi:GPH family glycoside/pentoside/hexuronide:cation symporter